MKINDILRAGHVKRWHTVHTLREQSIAEHQWNVARVANTIANKLDWGPKEIYPMIYFADIHDLEEISNGDVPSHKKAQTTLMSNEQMVIKGADLIDAEWFMLNYRGPGSHAQAVFEDVQRRLDQFIIDCPSNIGEAVMKVRSEVMDPKHDL